MRKITTSENDDETTHITKFPPLFSGLQGRKKGYFQGVFSLLDFEIHLNRKKKEPL